MAPFPAVFTLQHIRVYVHTMNCGNEATYVKSPIDEALGFGTALHVLYINLYNGHIQLRGGFDYP